jgi:hypothetical protein
MKSHALSYLVGVVEENEIEAPEVLSEADVLSPWAVEFRYEGEEPPALDRSAALALNPAERRKLLSSLFDHVWQDNGTIVAVKPRPAFAATSRQSTKQSRNTRKPTGKAG